MYHLIFVYLGTCGVTGVPLPCLRSVFSKNLIHDFEGTFHPITTELFLLVIQERKTGKAFPKNLFSFG